MAKIERLELDDELLARIGRSKRPGRRRFPVAAVFRWLLLLCVLAAGSWGVAEWVNRRVSRDTALSETMIRLLESLAREDYQAAAGLCAESPRGQELLEASNAERLTAAGMGARAGNAADLMAERVRLLSIVRRDAEGLGVDWSSMTPLAFGGVKGLLTAPGLTRRPVPAIIGSAYFVSAGDLYRLEVSLRECQGEYVVTEVWQCSPSDADPAAIREDSYQRFLRFNLEPPAGGARYQVDEESHIFVDFAR